jgi:hypothetical protein
MANIQEITDELFDVIYQDYDGVSVEDILKQVEHLIGKELIQYDEKIDNGIDDKECEDEYVICSCYSTKDDDFTLKIYFGNNTQQIFDINFNNN